VNFLPSQNYEKPKVMDLEFIPSQLESNYYGYHRSKLLKDGYVLSQYKNSGTMILCHPEYPNDWSRIGNNAKVMALAVCLPLIVSAHEVSSR
jgi:hypothetical protein